MATGDIPSLLAFPLAIMWCRAPEASIRDSLGITQLNIHLKLKCEERPALHYALQLQESGGWAVMQAVRIVEKTRPG